MPRLLLIFFLLLFAVIVNAQDTPALFKKIIKGNYTFNYSTETKKKVFGTEKFSEFQSSLGIIKREKNNLYVEWSKGIGIVQDSITFLLDTLEKDAKLLPESPVVVNPLYDPYGMLEYVKYFNASSKIFSIADTIFYEYTFPDNVALSKLIFWFSKNPKTFFIELEYFQRAKVVSDFLTYNEIANDTNIKMLHVDDFLEKRNDVYVLKEPWRNYKFDNVFERFKRFNSR